MKLQSRPTGSGRSVIGRKIWLFCHFSVLGFLWMGLLLSHVWGAMPIPDSGGLDPQGRTMSLSLEEAILEALKRNTDIAVSRYTHDVQVTDILFEQAKFDPTVMFSSRYDRSVEPLNRPIFGLGGSGTSSEPDTLDQNTTTFGLGFSHPLRSGGLIDLKLDTGRTSVAGDTSGFLFNPGYLGNLRLGLTHPLLRNFGEDVNQTRIRVAKNSAKIEGFVVLDQVLKIVAQVEQAYWELIFAQETLQVAQANQRAAHQLLISNRAKMESGVLAEVDVLQAQASVASRVEDVLIAQRRIGDQEDQLRRLLLDSDDGLHEQVTVLPKDDPVQVLHSITFQEAIQLALKQRPEVLQAKKILESRDLDLNFAENQLLPNLELQSTIGLTGIGDDLGSSADRLSSRDFYNVGVGLVLSYPLGNRSATSQTLRQKLEVRKAQVSFQNIRQQVVVNAKEAVRRLKTDFKRIESTQVARKLAKKQLTVEQKRLNVGLSTTRIVLDFQSDLAEARGNELRAIVDYNQSLANLYLATGTNLDRYHIQLETVTGPQSS